MDDDSEPTWGENLAASTPPSSVPGPLPNQRSMPVVGRSAPPVAKPPHAEYHRQTAQYFGNPVSDSQAPPTPQAMPTSYPVVPPVTYPAVPPASPMSGQQPPASYPAGPVRDSFIQRFMQRGVRGELFRQPWFQDMKQRNPDPFVFVSFAVGVVVSLVLMVIPSSFVVTVLTTPLWVGIGYLYFALGTKLAHQFVLFGICLVGGLLMGARALWSMVALSVSGGRYYGFGGYQSVVELMFVMLINLVGVAAFAYIGVQVYRGIRQMSQP